MRPTLPQILPLTAALTLAALPALAQPTSSQPPQSTQFQNAGVAYWVDPNTGCSYTRAQAHGHAPTWHLIVNGSRIGMTDAKAGCAVMLRSGG